jgi:hypothetical protein
MKKRNNNNNKKIRAKRVYINVSIKILIAFICNLGTSKPKFLRSIGLAICALPVTTIYISLLVAH